MPIVKVAPQILDETVVVQVAVGGMQSRGFDISAPAVLAHIHQLRVQYSNMKRRHMNCSLLEAIRTQRRQRDHR